MGDAEFLGGFNDMPTAGDRLWRRNRQWVIARVDTNAQGNTAVTLMPAEVVRDESWPKPFTVITTR